MEVGFETVGQNRHTHPPPAQEHPAGGQSPRERGWARRGSCGGLPSPPLPAGSPYALIVRRYLSLLDAAVELEFRDYSGPRLDPRYRVLMFEHALTADEANRKYRSAAGGGLGRGWEGSPRGESVAGGAVASAGHPTACPLQVGRRCGLGHAWVTLFWQDPS